MSMSEGVEIDKERHDITELKCHYRRWTSGVELLGLGEKARVLIFMEYSKWL